MKQETLDEAAERAVKSGLFKDKTLFKAGAKWQEKRMYNEEDVLSLILKFNDDKPGGFDASGWFEQFKKK